MSTQLLKSKFWFSSDEPVKVVKADVSEVVMAENQTESIDKVNSMMKYCALRWDVQFRSLQFNSDDVSESKSCFNDCATRGYQMLQMGSFDGNLIE